VGDITFFHRVARFTATTCDFMFQTLPVPAVPVTFTASHEDEEASGYHVPLYPRASAKPWHVLRIPPRPPQSPFLAVDDTNMESSSFVFFQLIFQVGVTVGVGVAVGVTVAVGVRVGVGVGVTKVVELPMQ
jgi:hypothetical protein